MSVALGRRALLQCLVSLILLLVYFAPSQNVGAEEGAESGWEWPRAEPRHVGIDPAPIEALVEAISRGRYVAIDSLLILRHGQLVSENYFAGFRADDPHETRSTFKSIAGLLFGIAIGEGRITRDTLIVPLIERFHILKDPDPRKRQMRVSHLLDMQSGLDCLEMPNSAGPYRESAANQSDDAIAANVEFPMADAPGTVWRYCSSNSFNLGIALEAALLRDMGETVETYLNRTLMTPLGIDYRQAYVDRGMISLKGGQRMRPQDLAKIGQLLLNGGAWKGRQIVPADWIDEILSPGVPTGWSWTDSLGDDPMFRRESTYRHQWFQTLLPMAGRDIRLVHSWGNGGQFIIVLPDLDMVVVTTGSNFGAAQVEGQKQIFTMLHRIILPAVIE